MKQMSTLQLGKNIYEINDATARKLITELSKNLDNVKVVDGKSAYEIAVENGFVGSEADWLASLKGEKGDTGNGISDIAKTSTTNNIDTYTITFTNGNTINYNITNGVDGVGISDISYKETDSNGNYIYTITLTDDSNYDIIVPKGDIGIQGIQGEVGETPNISMTAEVDNTVGTPSVTVTKSGTNESPSFNLAFSNLKGETGSQGEQGVQGTQGLSAYEVAVQNGFSGTESEWLESLKGEEYDDEPIWKVQGELGAKNLLVYPYKNTNYKSYGVTGVVNEDGSITLNGTSTADVYFILVNQDFGDTNITSVSASTGYIASLVNGSTSVYLSYNSVTRNTSLAILKNTTLDNLTVYPMMRYAADTDDTWQPYAMSNKQLTDAIYNNGEEIDNESTVSQELKANYFYLFTNAVESLKITLPSNRRPWNEFNFAFTTSSSGCNLALPSAVTWLGDTPTLDADTYYEVSIKNNKAVIA